MADLMFKRGKQAALNTIINERKAVDGCFYLTEDTNRLYVGQGDNTAPILLNQTVQVVNRLEDLPGSPPATDNDFYYVKNLNILAVYDSSSESKWVQINPDTDTNDIVTVDNIEFAKSSASEQAVEYTLTLKQKKYNIDGTEVQDDDLTDLTATLTLKTEDIANIVPEAAQVGLKTKDLASGVEIFTQGNGSDGTKLITLAPGDNIDDISADADGKITIKAHNNTYVAEVVVNDGAVSLQLIDEVDETTSNIKFKNGKDIVITGDATDNSISISHSIYDTKNAAVENKLNLIANEKLNIISAINLDNGHISSIETSTLTMPADTRLKDGVGHQDNSWIATLTDSNDSTWNIDFSDDAETLEKKLTDYIDQGLAAANTALTYKTTISDPRILDTLSNVEVGDVYLLDTNITVSDISYRKGDLFIATSKSGKAGVLESDDLEWTYVSSGDELIIDTLFKGVATIAGKTGITDTNDNGSASFNITAVVNAADGSDNTPSDNQSLKIIAGQDLEIINNTGASLNNKVATMRHKTVTTGKSTGEDKNDVTEITAISGIEIDNGHITNIENTTYKLATYELSGNDNKIVIMDSAESECGSINVTNDTWINASVKDNVLNINHADPNTATHQISVTNAQQLTENNDLNIISAISYDDKGHITQVDVTKLTTPKDTTYQYYVADENSDKLTGDKVVSNPRLILEDRDETKWTAQMSSENTSLEVQGSQNKVSFNLVWGTF